MTEDSRRLVSRGSVISSDARSQSYRLPQPPLSQRQDCPCASAAKASPETVAPFTLIHTFNQTYNHSLTMSDMNSYSEEGSDWNVNPVDPGGRYIYGVWRADGDTTPIIHSAYTNEQDSGKDLVIQTTDNILFHVHSYYLKAAR
jgi:hypothetical protein